MLKWNFTAPRAEFVDQLRDQMTAANFNTTLLGQMFNRDFKQHLKAIESLSAIVSQDLTAVTANLDLLLKWVTLRFFESNPSVQIRGLELLREVFTGLADQGYNLHDIEAASFIPFLLLKSGDPKDPVRTLAIINQRG